MAYERNFWQVLIVGTKYEAGVYMRVLEYPTRELAEETVTAVNRANKTLTSMYLGAFPLYPTEPLRQAEGEWKALASEG